MNDSPSTTLRIAIGDYPHTLPLKRREIVSPWLKLDFVEVKPMHKAFKPMVREHAFDASEMALITYFQAKEHNKGLRLLPAAMLARFQHGTMLFNAARGKLTPSDLPGRRIGVRSWSQTTGAWLRGILANDYGIDLDSIQWITFEDAHVAEFRDTTARAPAGKQIIQMLIDGDLDAVLGEKFDHPALKPLFPDVAAEEKSWFAKHQVMPINHMVVVSETLTQQHPEAVREVFRLLQQSAALAPAGSPQFNVGEMRRSLELIIRYAAEQGLIPRALAVEELFDDVTRPLFEGMPA